MKKGYALHRFGLVLLLLASWSSVAGAELLRPPCGVSPWPPYAEVSGPPRVEVWKETDTGSRWDPPACTGWAPGRFDLVVVVSGHFRGDDRVETLLSRFGAVSRWTGVRYWSVSNKRWKDLIVDAHALSGADGKQRRGDFTADEMKPNRDLYFRQTITGSGPVVYRVRVREVVSDRLVLETENVSTVRAVGLPLFKPGDFRTLYFLERSSPGVWRYYSLAGVDRGSNPLTQGHEASYINRAIAIFRYLAGLRTDQEPPAAP